MNESQEMKTMNGDCSEKLSKRIGKIVFRHHRSCSGVTAYQLWCSCGVQQQRRLRDSCVTYARALESENASLRAEVRDLRAAATWSLPGIKKALPLIETMPAHGPAGDIATEAYGLLLGAENALRTALDPKP